jgi:hypothetical protein
MTKTLTLTTKYTKNIGDEIQIIAAKQFVKDTGTSTTPPIGHPHPRFSH